MLVKTGRVNGSNGIIGSPPGGLLRGVAIDDSDAVNGTELGIEYSDESVFLAGDRPRLESSHHDPTCKSGTRH